MNRRTFLQWGALSVAALAIDPERLIWTPGQKTVFDLGPTPYRLMLGDWRQVRGQGGAVWEQWVMTVVNRRMYGVTARIDLSDTAAYVSVEQQRQAQRHAERRLDALAKWALRNPHHLTVRDWQTG